MVPENSLENIHLRPRSKSAIGAGETGYIFPSNNSRGNVRLDVLHEFYRYHFHGNYTAPVEESLMKGIKVLDVGCGSGRWCLEMSADYPNSTFVGIDIASPFPTEYLPSRCSFLNANILEELPFPDNHFDFVHQRLMSLYLGRDDWIFAMEELKRVTKPGGWIEIVESDMKLERGPPSFHRFLNAAKTLFESHGIDITFVGNLAPLFAGLESVEIDFVSSPTGWNGRQGEASLQNFFMFAMEIKDAVMPLLGCDDAEYYELMVQIRRESKKCRSWSRIPYALGMKPLNK